MKRMMSLSILLLVAGILVVQPSTGGLKEAVPGVWTERIIPGEPYELAGKRIVFANWYYIQPGDLDWVNAEGKSVYVEGNEAPDAAIFKGIRTPYGIQLRTHKPELRGPISAPHRTILQDGNRYRAWTDNEYLESADGMEWKRIAGLKLDKDYSDGIWHVFIDATAPAEQRYKTTWNGIIDRKAFEDYRKRRPDGWEPRALLHYLEKGEVSCIRGGYSSDGITWHAYPDPISVEYADTFNTAYYDSSLKRYVLYTRQWSIGPRTGKLPADIRNSWTGSGRRAIGRSQSIDFRNFPPSELIIEPTPEMLPSESLYTNCRTTVPGAPEVHLMFPAIWNASATDDTRIGMLSSHDGKVWHWAAGGSILETGEFGKWNGGCIWARPNLIELADKSWALPYLAHKLPHKYPRGQQAVGVGYAVWPKGRMLSVDADEMGEFYLMQLMPPGRRLKINATTRRTGRIWLEVTGVDGRRLEQCDPVFGDQFWNRVTWQGQTDLGHREGSAITLRIKMKQAKLFGLEFE
jgi:hypothetical protein